MSLPRYPEYKDSGVEWLGDVPAHWQTKRLRHVADLNPSKNETASLARDTEVSFLPMEAIGEDGTITLEQTRLLSQVETGYTYFRDGDVAVAKITPCFENGKGAVMSGLLGGVGFGSTELIVSRPRPEHTNSNYLSWIFNSTQFRKLAEGAMYGAGGQKRVPDDFVRNFAMAFPPVAEQTAIATFLDRETAKIDGLIAEQEKLIALLAEKRQATISNAVTKGLNPNAPMKDSGVAWLGEMPAHWDASKIKSLCYINDGNHGEEYPEASDYTDETDGVPFIRAGNIKNMKVSSFEMLYITQEKNSSMRKGGLKTGDILFTNRGEIGKVATVSADFNGANLNSQIAYLRPETAHLDRIFTAYFLSSDLVRHVVDSVSAGSVLTQFPIKDLKQIPITLPPLIEQTSIASFLDSETNRLDVLSLEANRGISLLKERRSALISAAVTGKIDVREVA